MADYTAFVTAYPEFAGADQNLVLAKLTAAQRQLDLTVFGPLSDDAVYLLTAQILAKSPFGNSAKLSSDDGKTVYDEDLARLRLDAGSGRGIT